MLICKGHEDGCGVKDKEETGGCSRLERGNFYAILTEGDPFSTQPKSWPAKGDDQEQGLLLSVFLNSKLLDQGYRIAGIALRGGQDPTHPRQ
jgi:hypothetical protein